ncbi:MAG: lysophospholipase [Rhizobacter sp.]|nr:lysophospholipase [Rhizobacter sp.]
MTEPGHPLSGRRPGPPGPAPVDGRWRRWAGPVAAALASLALLAGCATLDQQQARWIFQPSERAWWGGLAAAEGMQDVWIEFDSAEAGQSVKLHGLWLPQPHADAPLLLYLHGARYDVRGSAHRMRRMHELGFSVLGVDYRGFGKSSNLSPTEAAALEDARAAWGWLARQQPQARRYLFGHSLGGAIAVHLAAEVGDAAGLIVEGSFTSIPDVFSTLKWGWLPVGPLITQRFDAALRIARVRAPVLVVHGSADGLIRPELGRALYERATAPKRFVLVEGGSHHSTNAIGQPLYRQALADLFGLSPQP